MQDVDEQKDVRHYCAYCGEKWLAGGSFCKICGKFRSPPVPPKCLKPRPPVPVQEEEEEPPFKVRKVSVLNETLSVRFSRFSEPGVRQVRVVYY